MFLCLQTKKKDCDNFVITLFILYQKSYKRKCCLIYSVISITLHHKYGETVENTNANYFITKTKQAEQTDDLSVNRLGHVQLKGNLEKKMAG